MGQSRFILPKFEYVCPHCKAPLVESGRTFVRGVSRPVVACTNCKTDYDGPPPPGAVSAARLRAVLAQVFGLAFIALAIVVGGVTGLALALLGLVVIAAGIAVVASIVRTRSVADYWQQYRRV